MFSNYEDYCMKKFALIGGAGFVAPRHMKAIKETGNEIVAILDPHDSVGIIDSYFPDSSFFTEFERFDRHLEKLKRNGEGVDFISICSPNYLHDAHCRFALRLGADAICEKPLVLNPWNLDQLQEIENETGKKIYSVLQLRLYKDLIKLKQLMNNKIHKVNIDYITPRGNWYGRSWKGDITKSGGLATNIGIHLFDIVLWLFGSYKQFTLTRNDADCISGIVDLERALVTFNLSTNREDLPDGCESLRLIEIDGSTITFDKKFTDLHTAVYKDILDGYGFGIDDARPSVELTYRIRDSI
jgi:UDP-N-acetyl-2-amino-2-deoxyglucuronate dehydrogenase